MSTWFLLCRNQGLIPRSLHYIINGMGTFDFKSRFDKEDEKVTLEMSFLEDYQNCIYDLLSPTIRVGQSKPMLNARSDANGFLHIINLTVEPNPCLHAGKANLVSQRRDGGHRDGHQRKARSGDQNESGLLSFAHNVHVQPRPHEQAVHARDHRDLPHRGPGGQRASEPHERVGRAKPGGWPHQHGLDVSDAVSSVAGGLAEQAESARDFPELPTHPSALRGALGPA